MKITYDAHRESITRLKDLKRGDVFEVACAEPKAIYLVVENQWKCVRYVSLTNKLVMPRDSWFSNKAVRKLEAELFVRRES